MQQCRYTAITCRHVGLVERRLRQQRLRSTRQAASRRGQENHMESQQETRDFGEVLWHELNNPLTVISRLTRLWPLEQ